METGVPMRGEVSKSSSGVEGAQSISRALQVLRAVARAGRDGVGLVTLTRDLDMSKPTIHRLLTVLVFEGMLEQDDVSRRYYLGPECHTLGYIAADRHGVNQVAAPIVQRMADDCGDSAFFSVRRGVSAVCVMREDGDFPLKTYVLAAGDRYPLGVGAGSLALLAALDDDDIDDCLAANAQWIETKYPEIPPDGIRRQVEETRARGGVAINRGWVMAGSWGIGLAVRDSKGRVLGSLSIAAVQSRMNEERLQTLSDMLQQASRRLLRQYEVSRERALREPERDLASRPKALTARRARVADVA